jgi:D-alanyl-D-alanine carboxypeptidase
MMGRIRTVVAAAGAEAIRACRRFLPAMLLAALGTSAPAADFDAARLDARLEAFLAANPDVPGVAVVVLDRQGREIAAGAAGVSEAGSPGAPAFTADTPVRIASNTKTYVAATVLKLWESGRIGLDSTLASTVDPDLTELLERGGYDPSAITIRQVLAHSAGFFNHATAETFQARVLAEPSKVWTRMEQIAVAVEAGEPVGPPGGQPHYSDTGYLILGHVIERTTGRSLAAAVREVVGFDRLGLSRTWWEVEEAPPAGSPERAHQYLGGLDTHGFHPSFDLYGGGGIVASVRDLGAFTAALFRGEPFERDSTLGVMIEGSGSADPARYRFGLEVGPPGGRTTLGHGGFWGTIVRFVPELGLTVAGAVTEKGGSRSLEQLIDRLLAEPDEGIDERGKRPNPRPTRVRPG